MKSDNLKQIVLYLSHTPYSDLKVSTFSIYLVALIMARSEEFDLTFISQYNIATLFKFLYVCGTKCYCLYVCVLFS